MMSRPLSLFVSAALLPCLAACSNAPASGPVPLTDEALAAVTDTAGAPKDQLAREVDDLFAMEGLGETRAVVLMADGELAAERYGVGYDRSEEVV